MHQIARKRARPGASRAQDAQTALQRWQRSAKCVHAQRQPRAGDRRRVGTSAHLARNAVRRVFVLRHGAIRAGRAEKGVHAARGVSARPQLVFYATGPALHAVYAAACGAECHAAALRRAQVLRLGPRVRFGALASRIGTERPPPCVWQCMGRTSGSCRSARRSCPAGPSSTDAWGHPCWLAVAAAAWRVRTAVVCRSRNCSDLVRRKCGAHPPLGVPSARRRTPVAAWQ